MTSEKAVHFLDSIITKTKEKAIEWDNLYCYPSISAKFSDLNSTFSYQADLPNGYIVLGLDKYDEINFFVVPDNQPVYNLSTFVQDFTDDNYDIYHSKLQRLYDIVYSSLPSIDSFLDDFLNS